MKNCDFSLFDGRQILLTQRCSYAIENMVNSIDFDRMSPSYEYRLSKYLTRGFGIYIPGFHTNRVNSNLVRDWVQQRLNMENSHNSLYYVSVKQLKALNGLDLLLYFYFYFRPLGSVSSLTTDYGSANIPISRIYDHKARTFNGIIETFDISNGLLRMRRYTQIEYYDRKNLTKNVETMIKELFNPSYLPENVNTTESGIRWKVVHPGEQTTGTFHRKVYENPNVWYSGIFYRKDQARSKMVRLLEEYSIPEPKRGRRI